MGSQHGRFVGAHEIRLWLGGVSRQRTYQITCRAGFPDPVADLAQGKVWLGADVEAWFTRHRPHQAGHDQR